MTKESMTPMEKVSGLAPETNGSLTIDITKELEPTKEEIAEEQAFNSQDDDDGVEVETSSFFDEDQSSKQPKLKSDVSEKKSEPKDIPTVVKYKADGKEYTLDLSTEEGRKKAIQALSMENGARKAFSEVDKLKKEIKKFKELEPKFKEQSQIWEKLESLKHDKKALFEAVAGEKFEEVMKKEVERARMRELATPEELKLYDEVEKASQYKLEMERIRQENERQKRLLEETNIKAHEAAIHPIFERFSDFEKEGHDEVTSNRMRKMLWRNSIEDLKEYGEQGHELTPKLMTQVFNANAKLLRGNEKVVEKKTQEVLEKKAETAKKQAQVASTANYSNDNDLKDLAKLRPLDLFKKLTGRS